MQVFYVSAQDFCKKFIVLIFNSCNSKYIVPPFSRKKADACCNVFIAEVISSYQLSL